LNDDGEQPAATARRAGLQRQRRRAASLARATRANRRATSTAGAHDDRDGRDDALTSATRGGESLDAHPGIVLPRASA
jgi:hypothetical protein